MKKRVFVISSILFLLLALAAAGVRLYSSEIFRRLQYHLPGASREVWESTTQLFMHRFTPALQIGSYVYALLASGYVYEARGTMRRRLLLSLCVICLIALILYAVVPLSGNRVGWANMIVDLWLRCLINWTVANIPCVCLMLWDRNSGERQTEKTPAGTDMPAGGEL